MKHLGDITKIKGNEAPVVDIITGGSPCQDLSIAGKRAGLAGERSGLFMEQIRIIKEMREHDRATGRTDDNIRPRYMVWENVPGAFSSNKGEDFRAVLEETAKVVDKGAIIPGPPNGRWTPAGCIMGDGWSIAWRVHDAQFWGVPQRRKRISLVADFGGESAPKILFEREGVPGNPAESEEPGQGTAGTIGGSAEIPSRVGIYDVRISSDGTKNWRAHCYETGISRALDTGGEDPDSNHGGVAIIEEKQATAYGICSYDSNSMKSSNPRSGIYHADTARTLDLNGGTPACNQGGMAIVQEPTCIQRRFSTVNLFEDGITPTLEAGAGEGGNNMPMVMEKEKENPVYCLQGNGIDRSDTAGCNGKGWREGASYTLNTLDRPAVAVIENHPADSRVKVSKDGMVQTLSSRMGTGGGNVPMVMNLNSTKEENASTLGPCDYKEPQAVCIGNGQTNQSVEEKAGAINCMHDQQAVITYGLDRASFNQGQNAKFDFNIEEEKIGAQVARGPGAICKSVVRRLTPMECERLQGYPDGWTDIGDWIDSKGKKHKGEADAPRYKALGNSIALPFWQWMAERMVANYDRPTTMASLFDGIGGFPLVFKRVGCKPIWASEIEEFPIAVTKIRFPEEETEDEAIEEIPNDWIPISKELPKTRNNYLVTVAITDRKSKEEAFVYTAIDHYNGDGKWTNNNTQNQRVIAWKKLDEPYKEKAGRENK